MNSTFDLEAVLGRRRRLRFSCKKKKKEESIRTRDQQIEHNHDFY
jgi:hypothetical protein